MGRSVENAPDGDGGAEHTFELEAYVWCPREAAGRDGSLTGIAFYLHTKKGREPRAPAEGAGIPAG